MSTNGLSSLINQPTRSSSCLDHVFYRLQNGSEIYSSVLDLKITDHAMIYVTCKDNSSELNVNQHANNSSPSIDFTTYCSLIKLVKWDHIYAESDVNIAFQCFIDILIDVKDKSLYSKPYNKTKKKKKQLKPWMNENLCYRTYKKYKLYKKTKLHPNNLQLKRFYKQYCTELAQSIVVAKENYYRTKFEKFKNKPKHQWRMINDLLGHSMGNSRIEKIQCENGNISTDPIVIANELNNHFVTVCEKLKSNIDHSTFSTMNPRLFYNSWVPTTFFFQPVTRNELLGEMLTTNNKQSSGFDGINNCLLKKIAPYIIDILTHLFNLSLSSGVFPECLKQAIVIPLYKKDDCQNPSNYRPISLLLNISKLLEKIVKIRILNFLQTTNFFNANQFGFREKLNTEDALTSFLNSIYDSMNNNLKTSALFIDITKAFDMVDHTILLDKLWKAGFRGVSLLWFKTYLENRSQKVKLNDNFSESMCINSGVPQGSVLGPILFLIYINSLSNLELKGKVVAFADDMSFAYSACDRDELKNQMNHDLSKLRLWFTAHSMILSNKTKCMFFNLSGSTLASGREIIYHSISCNVRNCVANCLSIEEVNEFKYLGVVLDSTLSFKQHIIKLKSYLYACIKKFYFLRKLVPKSILLSLYHSLIQSKLQYGIICWGGTYLTNLKPILIAQKFFIRLILKRPRRTPSFPLFKQLKILPFRYIYIFKVLRLFYLRSGQFPERFTTYNLRRHNMYFIPLPKSEHFRRYFLFTGPRLFNMLPIDIKTENSQEKFTNSVRDWLFSLNTVEHLFDAII